MLKQFIKCFSFGNRTCFSFLKTVHLSSRNFRTQNWVSLVDEGWNLFKETESPVAHDTAISITMTLMTENLYQKKKKQKKKTIRWRWWTEYLLCFLNISSTSLWECKHLARGTTVASIAVQSYSSVFYCGRFLSFFNKVSWVFFKICDSFLRE